MGYTFGKTVGRQSRHQDLELLDEVLDDMEAGTDVAGSNYSALAWENRDVHELVKDYDPKRDGNPPGFVSKEDEPLWERAKKAVDPEGEGSTYDEPWAVVTHVFRRIKAKHS